MTTYSAANRVVVSIHAPTGGATGRAGGRVYQGCFNSRAHGGRDRVVARARHGRAFQFTRPRGARLLRIPMLDKPYPFQFTRPRGARHLTPNCRNYGRVSIHAPTGGATRAAPAVDVSRRFNSRAHGGRDICWTNLATNFLLFQFTRPRGARPDEIERINEQFVFQFTRPRGARHVAHVLAGRAVHVSIHAPTGGATRGYRLV